jgi:hypothetical protein
MAGHPREPEPGTGVPRWVKFLGIVALVLLVIFVIAQVTGVAGEHRPGRHLPGGHRISAPPAIGRPVPGHW